MRWIAVHIDGLEGLCRAGMLTAAAAHADGLVHLRDNQLAAGRIQVRLHVHRLGGAVFRACPAIGVVRIDHAVFLDEFCHAYLGALFLLLGQRQDGAAGADT